MPEYVVTLTDGTLEIVADADAYQQEGQMTTFFASSRGVVDCWATRLASFRTADIRVVRRYSPDGTDRPGRQLTGTL